MIIIGIGVAAILALCGWRINFYKKEVRKYQALVQTKGGDIMTSPKAISLGDMAKWIQLAVAGIGIANEASAWLSKAKDPAGPSGEKIDLTELVQLDSIVSKAFQAAGFPVEFTARVITPPVSPEGPSA